MSFEVAAGRYGAFMGRYAEPLAGQLADRVGLRPGSRALDVGCGPGALTAVLVDRLGADHVAGIDPSAPFVAAARDRLPGADVRAGVAEHLPWDDGSFDVALAQLVVHFMADPVQGLREMARVTRPGGTVAASVWDFAGGRSPLDTFWRAVRDLDPDHPGETELPGTRAGQLGDLARRAGLDVVAEGDLEVAVAHASFEEWWAPYTHGVGPAGAYVAGLDDAGRDALRSRCEELCPPAPFTVRAAAWVVQGVVRDA